jgi:methylenetetrahydrofolate reductase (NADPH)
VAATVAAEQCRRLFEAGIAEYHFYTLNRADLTYAICHILGLRALPAEFLAEQRATRARQRRLSA